VTLRERIAQTVYWKLKLSAAPITNHIKVYFITPDEDGTLTIKKPTKKGRAIVESDIDGSYVMSEANIEGYLLFSYFLLSAAKIFLKVICTFQH
jgi:type II restriction enzyme